MKNRILILTLLTVILITSAGFTAPLINLSDSIISLPMGKYLDILEDTGKKITLHDIIHSGDRVPFRMCHRDVPNFAFSDAAYWVRFRIKADNTVKDSFLLELSYPLMDQIEFYSPDESGNYTCIKTGYAHPFESRPIQNRYFIFPFKIKPDSEKMIYMRFVNQDRMEIPLTLWSTRAFTIKDRNDQYIMGTYLGIVVIMILFNLLLFISIRDRTYLFYVIFLTTYGFFQLTQNGLVYEYLWPASLSKFNHVIPLTIAVTLMSTILFTRSFLNTADYFPRMNRVMKGILALYCVTIVLDFFIHYGVSVQIQVVMAILTLSVSLYVGIIAFLKKYRPAKFFMLAWTAILIGGIVYALKVIDVLPSIAFTNYALQTGSVILILLLSFGLGDRINLIKEEREDAQNAALQAQREIIKNMKEMNKQKDVFLEETSRKNREIAQLNVSLEKHIEELNLTNHELAISEERYRFLVEETNDIIFTLDENLDFITANAALKRHLKVDLSAQDAVNFVDLIYEDYQGGSVSRQIVQEKLERFLHDRKPVAFRAEFKTIILQEPREFIIRMEYITVGDTVIILGKASIDDEDSLMKYIECERQRFSIQNYLIIADDVSRRITRNLRKFIDQKTINLIRIALREIIINAIEHGNLNITYDDKSRALDSDEYFEVLAERQRDPRYKDRRVGIEYHIAPDRVTFKISDQGEGFDYDKIISKGNEPEMLLLTHGRGIRISREVFDEVTYNKKGNQVLLMKRLDAAT